jgi:hypothetical protein
MKISTGINYVDHILGFLKAGDNVIWEVEAGSYIETFLQRFIPSFSFRIFNHSGLLYLRERKQ